MATIPQVRIEKRTDDDLAQEMLALIEGAFDDQGLTQAQRDERFEAVQTSMDAKSASHAKR